MVNSKISDVETTQTIYLEKATEKLESDPKDQQPVYKVAFLGVTSTLGGESNDRLYSGSNIQYKGRVRFYNESGEKISYSGSTMFNVLSEVQENGLYKYESRNVATFIGGYISSWFIKNVWDASTKNFYTVPINIYSKDYNYGIEHNHTLEVQKCTLKVESYDTSNIMTVCKPKANNDIQNGEVIEFDNNGMIWNLNYDAEIETTT